VKKPVCAGYVPANATHVSILLLAQAWTRYDDVTYARSFIIRFASFRDGELIRARHSPGAHGICPSCPNQQNSAAHVLAFSSVVRVTCTVQLARTMMDARGATACPVAGRRRHRNATRQKSKSESSIDRSPWVLKIFPLRDGYRFLHGAEMRRSASELAFRLHMASCQVVPVGSPSRLCMAWSGDTRILGLSEGNVKSVKIENS
jgi:hypothetical protein